MALALGSSASSLRVGSGTPSRMYRGSTAFWDADAAAYIRAVEAADGQALELGVCNAYHNFFLELKATSGLFSAIKASCILCGARTLAGALVPVVGTAPTAYGLVEGDYTRGGGTPGLKGDGTSYLDTNRNNNADPQNSKHYSVYMSQPNSYTIAYPGILVAGGSAGNDCHFVGGPSVAASLVMSVNNPSAQVTAATGTATEFMGASRSNSTSYQRRVLGATTTSSTTSGPPSDINFGLFTVIGSAGNRGDSRIAFYSIGTAVDLEALDTAVTNLITAIGNAL